MFWLEENLILSNVLITGESNFDEKMSKKCSTDQKFIRKRNTTYKIGNLGQNYVNVVIEWPQAEL